MMKIFRLSLKISLILLCLILSLQSVEASAGDASTKESEERGLQFLEDIQNSIAALAERVTPTVVNIAPIKKIGNSRGLRQRPSRVAGTGSGVIISEDGLIVTNNHVVGEDTTEAEIRLSDKTKAFARVVGRDKDTDIALLKMNIERTLPKAEFGKSSTLKVGQWVLAVGNPLGLDRTVTLGVISGIGRERLNLSKYENFIQTDAAINPGNSGGPLFNLRGEVVGINTAIIHMAQGIGFSIPSDMVARIVRQLQDHGRVVRGWLGVGIQPMTPELAKKFQVQANHGVLVNEVFEDQPAHRAGIKPGDIISTIGGAPVNTPNQLSRLVALVGPGETTIVKVIRDGVEMDIPVAMGEREEQPIVASLPAEQSDVTLGIDVQGLTAALAEKFSLQEDSGVLVSRVERGSLAHSEGIKAGDLIKEVNRKEVRTVSQFSEALKNITPGETILLRVIRKDRAFFVVLKPIP
ncbi:MAG: trypsin-like peptidase domain-containing protein [Nitrospirales bacterium]|nr:trypsin-like peptidase domain-containing protein [Nitrospira sp.]MDR4502771.1 trypsin-like peptidase domain-containing protein [Nitrospirales bacterium]